MDIDKIKELKKIVLIALFSDDVLMDKFVLKGGSAIDLIYKIDSRASVDIDVSMEKDFSKEELQEIEERINKSLKQTFLENGYILFDYKFLIKPKEVDPLLPENWFFWGGYEVEFKIIKESQSYIIQEDITVARKTAEIVDLNNGKKFSIDISKFEYCEPKETSDVDGYTIYVYSPKMIIIEKMRAICQKMAEYPVNKGYARKPRNNDFYDIEILVKHFNITFNKDDISLLRAIFEIKCVEVDLLKLIPKYKDLYMQHTETLITTITADKSKFKFEECFDYVVSLTKYIIELYELSNEEQRQINDNTILDIKKIG